MSSMVPNPVDPAKAHRSRLESMQQERIIDPNTKMKRYHWRAIFTPMMMKYWVPLFICFGGALALSNNLTMDASQRKRSYLESKGYGVHNRNMSNDLELDDRNRYMKEHLERVLAGENTFEVAEELQKRYKQEMVFNQRGLQRSPTQQPMSVSPEKLARVK